VVTRHPPRGKATHLEKSSSTSLIDFALITAIETERKALCQAFGLTDRHRVRRDARVYWRGRLSIADGEVTKSCWHSRLTWLR
jgi:hypothetical protein